MSTQDAELWQKFNMNDTVRVKLTDAGRKMHRASFDEFWRDINPTRPYAPPKEDADGYSEWQLWVLVKDFGQHIHMGMQIPFEENRIEFERPKSESRTCSREPISRRALKAIDSVCRIGPEAKA